MAGPPGFAAAQRDGSGRRIVVALDQAGDPHNVGALAKAVSGHSKACRCSASSTLPRTLDRLTCGGIDAGRGRA